MIIDPRLYRDYRPAAEAQVAALAQEYPGVPLRALELYDPEPGDRSLGHCDSDDTIVLSAFWFAEPRDKLDTAVARGRAVEPPNAMAWHGRIGGVDAEFDRLICHEFAHLLRPTVPGALRFARAGHAAALANPALAVSGYALVGDPEEWFAETFAALRLGGKGPQAGEMAAFLAGGGAKVAQDAVDYESRAKMPDRCCELCEHFLAPDGCARVDGAISACGWCRLFTEAYAILHRSG